jgi:hypothetical protein
MPQAIVQATTPGGVNQSYLALGGNSSKESFFDKMILDNTFEIQSPCKKAMAKWNALR